MTPVARASFGNSKVDVDLRRSGQELIAQSHCLQPSLRFATGKLVSSSWFERTLFISLVTEYSCQTCLFWSVLIAERGTRIIDTFRKLFRSQFPMGRIIEKRNDVFGVKRAVTGTVLLEILTSILKDSFDTPVARFYLSPCISKVAGDWCSLIPAVEPHHSLMPTLRSMILDARSSFWR